MSECGSHKSLLAVMVVVFAAPALACDETTRAGIGEACDVHQDCVRDAQCLSGLCAPRCLEHEDCGGGYVCNDFGLCEPVDSTIGDACTRELDCGPSQACTLDGADDNGDGRLAATCQTEGNGAATGGSCAGNDDCKTGICALGRCSEVCADHEDCPSSLACVDVPRLSAANAPLFQGCLQPSGVLIHRHQLTLPSASLQVAVPSHAQSFAVVAQVEDETQLVGVTRASDPNGAVLYQDTGDLYENPVRYEPRHGVSTFLLPNAPTMPLAVGAYTIDVASVAASGTNANDIPEVRVVYKLGGPGSVVDVNFYFLNLADHPCAKEFDDNRLSAAEAASSDSFQRLYLLEINDILDKAGISLGAITYTNVLDRTDLDSIGPTELGMLLSRSTTDSGINVFFVRSIDPPGVQVLPGGTPGTPAIAGTGGSGIAVSVETLCYRSWPQLARSTAHAMALQLGLFRNVEPDGHADPITDSDTSSNNLMYYSEFGGTDISPGQSQILRSNPVVR